VLRKMKLNCFFQDLKKILNASVKGILVLAFYQGAHKLDNTLRSDMLDCIVLECYKNSRLMGNKDFKMITQKIIELFPTEEADLYYQAPDNSQPNRHPSRGKLPDKYRNFFKKIRNIRSNIFSTEM
jgi:hypothetical protein